ncbi:hypothetical protein FRC12_005251 [Ceratobasidium sp. 428]|nr:hypothetical protein FRC12_005251 [Ceratobasidium sp. 428]
MSQPSQSSQLSQPLSPPLSQGATYISLPIQAAPPPASEPPYIAVKEGLATGVYLRTSNWHSLVKVDVPKSEMNPTWRLIEGWNEAIWFTKTGTPLPANSVAPGEVLPLEPRVIQSPEVLSLVYPPGSTLVTQSGDFLLLYTKNRMRQVTVQVFPELDRIHPSRLLNRSNSSMFQSLLSQPSLSQSSLSQSSFEVRTPLSPTGVVSATRSIPPSPFSSPTRPGSGVTSPNQGKQVFVGSNTPAPTLISSQPSTPDISIDEAAGSPISYQKSTYVGSSSRKSIHSSPERNTFSWVDSQTSSSQQSDLQSGASDVVSREGCIRLKMLSNHHHPDRETEAEINAYVLTHMLYSFYMTPEGIAKVRAALDRVTEF